MEARREDNVPTQVLPSLLRRRACGQHSGKAPSTDLTCLGAFQGTPWQTMPGVVESLLSLSKVRPLELPPVPGCFLCPLSQQVMEDPVIAADGVTYERREIADVMAYAHWASPVTGELMSSTEVTANVGLKAAIEGYVALRRGAEQQWLELELQVTGHMEQVSRRVRQYEHKAEGFRGRVLALGNPAQAAPAAPAAPLASRPAVPEAGSAPRPSEAPRPFSAGPAPRPGSEGPASKAARPPPRPPRSHLPPFQRLRAALTPRLTPRLARMVASPRRQQTSSPTL